MNHRMESRKSRMHDVVAKILEKKNFGHASSTLRGKGLIEYYELYRFPFQNCIASAVIRVGNQLDGPVGNVHGGIISLLFDDVMGFSCAAILPMAVTRDLAVVYKRPHPHEQFVVIRVYVDDEKTAQYNNDSNYQNDNKDGCMETKTSKVPKKKKRVFLRATCRSLGSCTDIERAPFVDQEDGVLYSTATITMVQVVDKPPSARKYLQSAHENGKEKEIHTIASASTSQLKSRL